MQRQKKVEKWRHVEIFPKNKSQTITIITAGDERYIMDGKHKTIPDKGYLLLDISGVDALGDAISVCWNDSGYKWKIASAYAELVRNKLDTTKFLYYEPVGKYGEPVSTGYLNSNCGGLLIREEEFGTRGDVGINYIK